MHFIREVLILFLFLKFSLCFTIENKLTYLKSLPGNEDRPSRIVYGGLASPNQFPYFGHYVIQRPSGWIFCGSSLIHPEWLLGSGHCVNGFIVGYLYFGSNDKENMPIFRNAITVIVHPSFQNPNPVANDISLSRLISPVPLSIAVNVIQLPSRSDSTRSFAGHLLTASGFGWNLYEYPRYLHFTHLVGISDATCEHHHWVFLNTMICAVGANHASSTCGGDSGGPLVSTSGGIDTLIGVSTFTQTLQCVNDVQGFMRVDKYLDWISFYTGIVIRN